MRFKPLGKRGIIRGLAVSGVAIASVTGMVMTQTPAFADPGVTYVAVGSDTVQDVMNGWATQLGGNLLGSYNATNPTDLNQLHQVITPVKVGNGAPTNTLPAENCSFNRPNGSGEGVIALRASLAGATGEPSTTTATSTPIAGQSVTIGTTTGNLSSNLPQQNCIDIARSSSTPASGTNGNVDPTAGALVYLPFGVDGVTSAIGSTAGTIENFANTGTEATPATNLSALAGVGFSLAGLQAMYAHGDDAVANNVTTGSGVCYAPTGGPDATTMLPAGVTCSSTVPVDLYVPQSGSGTLKFWASQLGFSSSSVPTFDFQTIQSDGGHTVTDYVGATVEEHDGTAVTVDPNGLSPFSIAQFIAQHNGHNPRFHQAQLLQVNGQNPETSSGTLNESAFPIQLLREVYNVVAWDRVVNTGDGNFDQALNQLLVSATTATSTQPVQTGVLCAAKPLIGSFGFAPITPTALSPAGLGGEAGGHYCGQIDQTNLRAFGPTTGF